MIISWLSPVNNGIKLPKTIKKPNKNKPIRLNLL